MSESAKIDLTKGTKAELLAIIKHIKAWDGGHNHPIYVTRQSMDSIANVENEINKML